jgi:hypothetical protein
MPINKNHEFEDLEGVKCSIVERNATPGRVAFLKDLLQYNGFNVVVVPTPAPKAVPAKPVAKPTAVEGEPMPTIPDVPVEAPPPPPATFTIGVTDVMFNPTNAIFGRLLHTPDGHVVTLAYWEEKEKVASDEVPYFENKAR